MSVIITYQPVSHYNVPACHCNISACHYNIQKHHYSIATCHYNMPTCHYNMPTCHYNIPTCHYNIPTCRYNIPVCYYSQGCHNPSVVLIDFRIFRKLIAIFLVDSLWIFNKLWCYSCVTNNYVYVLVVLGFSSCCL